MSPCIHVHLGDGVHALVKVPKQRQTPCSFCHSRPFTKLCDFVVSSPQQVTHVRTCDRKMCDKCATSVGEDKDYCPNHNQAPLPWDKAEVVA